MQVIKIDIKVIAIDEHKTEYLLSDGEETIQLTYFQFDDRIAIEDNTKLSGVIVCYGGVTTLSIDRKNTSKYR